MSKKLISNGNNIYRILEEKDESFLVINCIKRAMPTWINKSSFIMYHEISEEEFLKTINRTIIDDSELTQEQKNLINQRYGSISLILPVISDEVLRRKSIEACAGNFSVSKETIRYRLYDYLIYQTPNALISVNKNDEKKLTNDERNFRWALNKYYYNSLELSLKETYRRMLKDKYCDMNGNLLSDIPTFRQFNYYFYKTLKVENKIISRMGKGKFMRDYRILLGNSVRDFCKSIGYGMFDSTICDIFLVNDKGDLLGRPILTACVDAYSHICMGYSLGFKGGMTSLVSLIKNINEDKVKYCEKFGIKIERKDWNVVGLPHKFITDKGREYVSDNFSQLAELGIEIINLPPYRPELKGCVEKFFDLIQNSFTKQLATKGVIFPDYQERGGIDYRKKACLTIEDFEKIIIHCIINYNTKKIVDMPLDLVGKVKPFSSEIWNYELNHSSRNLINIDTRLLELTLLPRTKGKFRRDGLIVNKFRYKNLDFSNRYLTKSDCIVSYDPNNIGSVWLYEKGQYFKFEIIEKYLEDRTLEESQKIVSDKSLIEKECEKEVIQGAIDLYKEIEIIAGSKENINVNLKEVRKHRKNVIKGNRL